MGVTTSFLPSISTCVFVFVSVPFPSSLWFNSRSLLAPGITMLLLGWQYCVRMAFNVDNPLNDYVGAELVDATKIYLGILGILAICTAFVGQFFAYVLDLPEFLPFYALLPTSQRSVLSYKRRWRRNKSKDEDQLSKSDNFDEVNNKNITNLQCGVIQNVAKPYMHCFVATITFLVAVAATCIIYSLIFDEHKVAGLLCGILIPAVAYFIFWLYCTYNTSMYVFGVTEKNSRQYNKDNEEFFKGKDSAQIGEMTIYRLPDSKKGRDGVPPASPAVIKLWKETSDRVRDSILIVGGPHVALNLVLGLTRFFSDDIDVNWMVATGAISIVLLVTIAVGFYFWYISSQDSDDGMSNNSCLINQTTTTETTETTQIPDRAEVVESQQQQPQQQQTAGDNTLLPSKSFYGLTAQQRKNTQFHSVLVDHGY